MTRARAPTDRVVAARLGKLPRTVWGRFAAHFKRLTHCKNVRATASPLQNVRAACATKAPPAASNPSTAKSRTGRARRTRRRRRGAIPVWVFECALTAAALAIAAEGLRYVPTDTEHTFYIQAQIKRETLSHEFVDKIRTSLKWVDKSPYPLHITLVKVRCPIAKKKDVQRYINKTVKHDVQTVINNEPHLTFTIYSVATDFGRGNNTVAARCRVYPYTYFVHTLRDNKIKWESAYPKVEWKVETNFHITLGSYKKEQVDDPRVYLPIVREAFEKKLKDRTYGHNDLLPVSLANL